jgi:hypothetical protein
VLAIGLTPDVALRGKDHDDDSVAGRVGTPGTAATDTRASIASALTRVWLDAVARNSAAIDVMRVSDISGHDLRPDLQAVHPT